MNNEIRETLCDMGYDEAIVGVTDEGQVVYDYELMVHCLRIKEGMSAEEAVDFIDYNTIRALPYAGDNPPIIMNRLPNLEIHRQ